MLHEVIGSIILILSTILFVVASFGIMFWMIDMFFEHRVSKAFCRWYDHKFGSQ